MYSSDEVCIHLSVARNARRFWDTKMKHKDLCQALPSHKETDRRVPTHLRKVMTEGQASVVRKWWSPEAPSSFRAWHTIFTWKTFYHTSSYLILLPFQILAQLPLGKLRIPESRSGSPLSIFMEPCNFPSCHVPVYNHRYLCDCWNSVFCATLLASQAEKLIWCAHGVSPGPSTAPSPTQGINTHLLNPWTNNTFPNALNEEILYYILSLS